MTNRMLADLPSRRAIAAASALTFGAIFPIFVFAERPGLGIGHVYYIAIALAALAGGIPAGVAAGLLAAGLFAAGVVLNPFLPSNTVLTEGTLVRAATFVAIGGLTGWFATRHRQLIAELAALADRDGLTGLPNSRVFETAVARRIEARQPFLLALASCEVDADAPGMGDRFRDAAQSLLLQVAPDDDVSRIAANEFAILTEQGGGNPADLAARLEFALSTIFPTVSVGWSAFPRDGENALALYRAADERLYVRKVFRGQQHLPGAAVASRAALGGPHERIALDIRD